MLLQQKRKRSSESLIEILFLRWEKRVCLEEDDLRTNAVRPPLSVSFGSEPRLSNCCNSRSSSLVVAKHKLRGKHILPQDSKCSVSVRISSISGSLKSFKCCIKWKMQSKNKTNHPPLELCKSHLLKLIILFLICCEKILLYGCLLSLKTN